MCMCFSLHSPQHQGQTDSGSWRCGLLQMPNTFQKIYFMLSYSSYNVCTLTFAGKKSTKAVVSLFIFKSLLTIHLFRAPLLPDLLQQHLLNRCSTYSSTHSHKVLYCTEAVIKHGCRRVNANVNSNILKSWFVDLFHRGSIFLVGSVIDGVCRTCLHEKD